MNLFPTLQHEKILNILRIIFIKYFWKKTGVLIGIAGLAIAYQQLKQNPQHISNNYNYNFTIDNYKYDIENRKNKIITSYNKNNNSVNTIELNDIKRKLTNINQSFEKNKYILETVIEFIVSLEDNNILSINKKDLILVKQGSYKSISKALNLIINMNNKYSSFAAYNAALISEEQVDYSKAIGMYKKSLTYSNHKSEFADNAIKLAKKLNNDKAEDDFILKKYEKSTNVKKSSITSSTNKKTKYYGSKKIKKSGVSGTYIGGMIANKPEKCGIQHFKNNTMYIGNFKDGVRNGFGFSYFPKKGYFLRTYKNGKLLSDKKVKSSKMPEFKEKEYIGELKKGYSHGIGLIIYENNEKYLGIFKNGQRNGRGCSFFPNNMKIIVKNYISGKRVSSSIIK